MPVIAQLVELYRAGGIEISTGLPPQRFGGYGGAPDDQHRHLARWRRSYRKRLNRLRGLAGGQRPS
jgi:hypothetical protein